MSLRRLRSFDGPGDDHVYELVDPHGPVGHFSPQLEWNQPELKLAAHQAVQVLILKLCEACLASIADVFLASGEDQGLLEDAEDRGAIHDAKAFQKSLQNMYNAVRKEVLL
jgi:hypothetical protein